MKEQLDLGFEDIESDLQQVRIDRIRPSDVDTSNVKASIAALGHKFSAITLRETPGDTGTPSYQYEVVDGRRRVEALREQGVETVTAFIVGPDVQIEAEALTAALNLNRSPSPLREARAIAHLLDAGYTEDSLAKLGWKKSTIRKRVRLWNAPKPILDGVRAGDIAVTTAEKVANLSEHERDQAVRFYEEEGKLHGPDLRRIRQTRKEAEVAAMPDSLFEEVDLGTLSSDEQKEPTPGQQSVTPNREGFLYAFTEAVQQAALAGITQGELREALEQAFRDATVATAGA